MKRAAVILVAVILIKISIVVCFASSNACLNLSARAYNNRLFDICFTLDGESSICGAKFCLLYDSKTVKFCTAKSSNFEMQFRESDGEIEVAFASATAVSCSEVDIVLTFKGIAQGQSDIEVKNACYVDDKLDEHSLNSSRLSVSVSDESVVIKNHKTTKSLSKTTDKSAVVYNSENYQSTSDEASAHKEDYNSAVYIGCAVVAILGLGYCFVKRSDVGLKKND